MTWTATFVDAIKRDGKIAFTILYSDGSREIAREYSATSVTDESLKQIAIAEVADLARVDTASLELTVRPQSAIDLTPDPVDPPAQEDADRIQFFADLATWRQQQKLQALPADLKSRCLPEYVKGL